ncbi:MAG: hypothetical protein ABSG25_14340 [Bryobacteraceae bacterium]
MPGSTNKKVAVVRFDRESIKGFVNPRNYLLSEGVEVLSQSGSVLAIPYTEIKAVYFVREFLAEAPQAEPGVFLARPKMNGIWVRMRFRDGELMDGVLPNNLLQLDPNGFGVMPPNPASNAQWVFVPRAALLELDVLGVVGSTLRPRKPKPKSKDQIELFE